LIGLAAAVFGVAAGSIAAFLIVTKVMDFPFVFVAGTAAGAALSALMVTVVVGLAGTFSALGRKPAAVLRNL
jgi:putative ABC transport system permease protein